MYIRFETENKDRSSGSNEGIFTLAYSLLDDQDLECYQRKHIRELLDYFKANLPIPHYFSSRRQDNAICWLKADAAEMVKKFWELKIILEEYGPPVIVTKAEFVGKIVYSDKYQIVAIK